MLASSSLGAAVWGSAYPLFSFPLCLLDSCLARFSRTCVCSRMCGLFHVFWCHMFGEQRARCSPYLVFVRRISRSVFSFVTVRARVCVVHVFWCHMSWSCVLLTCPSCTCVLSMWSGVTCLVMCPRSHARPCPFRSRCVIFDKS